MMKNKYQTLTCDMESTQHMTADGFLHVDILVGKTGVQRYSCSEIDVEDVNGTGFVNVARLPEDVFNQKSLDSLNFIDITDRHPPEVFVTSDNYHYRTTGVLKTGAIREDKHIRIGAIIKKRATVDAVLKKQEPQVSLAYENDYIPESGILDGETYDYKQTNIHYNHLAIVEKGRAKTACILDEDPDMSELEDAQLKIKELEGQLAAVKTTATLDAEIDARATIQIGAKLLKDDITFQGKSNEQIQREALGDKITLDHDLSVVGYVFTQAVNQAEAKVNERAEHREVSFGKKRSATSDAETQKAEDAYEAYLNGDEK